MLMVRRSNFKFGTQPDRNVSERLRRLITGVLWFVYLTFHYFLQGIMLVYDITQYQSFRNIKQWLTNIDDVSCLFSRRCSCESILTACLQHSFIVVSFVLTLLAAIVTSMGHIGDCALSAFGNTLPNCTTFIS